MLTAYIGKAKDLRLKPDIEDVRESIIDNYELSEVKGLAEELLEDVKRLAEMYDICADCDREMEVTESHFEDRGIVHGATAYEEVVTALKCPRCGKRREM